MLWLKTNIAVEQLAFGSDNRHCNVQRQNTEFQLFLRIPSKSSAPPAMPPRKVLEIVPAVFCCTPPGSPCGGSRKISDSLCDKPGTRHHFPGSGQKYRKREGSLPDSSTVRREPSCFRRFFPGSRPTGRAPPVRPESAGVRDPLPRGHLPTPPDPVTYCSTARKFLLLPAGSREFLSRRFRLR